MLRKFIYLLLVVMLTSCSSRFTEAYRKLSNPEKTWVLFHPFKAKRAYVISQEVLKLKDSVAPNTDIGMDNNGGRLDAFKHSFWMARLSQGIGRRAALSLGKAHEKGNYQSFLKGQTEDGILPDKESTAMDLHNNAVGSAIGSSFSKASKDEIILLVKDSLDAGKLRILLKDAQGHFLDCHQKRIPLDSLKGKWNTMKCLVPSNRLIP